VGQPRRLHFLTGFFPTCTSGYCGTTAGGGWGAAPVAQQPPGSSLCLSPPVESLGPKSALCFYSYFVLICKIANSGPCPVECGWSLMYIIKYFCHNGGGFGMVRWPWVSHPSGTQVLPFCCGWEGTRCGDPTQPCSPPHQVNTELNKQQGTSKPVYLVFNRTTTTSPRWCGARGCSTGRSSGWGTASSPGTIFPRLQPAGREHHGSLQRSCRPDGSGRKGVHAPSLRLKAHHHLAQKAVFCSWALTSFPWLCLHDGEELQFSPDSS